MADHDRHALRALPVLAAAVAIFAAGPQWRERLAPAFSLQLAAPDARAQRLDGWIDPPRYTGRPPLMLDLSEGARVAQAIRAPANSVLVVQAAGDGDLRIDPGTGLQPIAAADGPPPDAGGGLQRARYRIVHDSAVRISAGGQAHNLAISVIADAPPVIELRGKPQGGARGSLAISYVTTDDYGLASGEAEIRLPGPAHGRSLAGPPQIPLNLPSNPASGAEMKTVAELASHPWAGAEVDLTLVVKDHAGQEGRSETVRITLPQRSFADPLARALVELRRDLILAPAGRERIQTALDALLIAPELFTPRAGQYLGLRRITGQLRDARNDEALRDVAAQLWRLALVIEDGDLSDAEKRLRQAQQALRDAIERGASEEETRRLSQELRQAMDSYMAEMSRQARNRTPQAANPNAAHITQDDLQRLLDRIGELTREGRREEAARLLDRLREIMENLQMAAPAQGGGQGQGRDGDAPQGEAAQRLGKALGKLDDLMREQQALRDETFRQGRQADNRRDDGGPMQGGGEAPGQGQGAGGAGRQEADGRQALGERQHALRRRLEELRRQLRREGAETGKGFGEAGDEMNSAGEALARDSHGEAVDAQGRALEQMRRGAQDLARQMAEADGRRRNAGEAGADAGQGGRDGGTHAGDGPQTDPLGRPLRGHDRGLGRMETGDGGEAAGARARRILDELRRRLGERQRDPSELEYLERLLGPR